MEKLRSCKIVVVGLGYVGFPLFVLFVKAGYDVVGYDISEAKIRAIERGQVPLGDTAINDLREIRDLERVKLTSNPKCIKDRDVIIVCVPTLMHSDKTPDLIPLRSATATIAQYLSPNQLIIYESSTYPGCTRDLLELLEQSGLKGGKDFNLAFSPERIDPGNQKYQLPVIPKVIGGLTPQCTARGMALYGTLFQKVVAVNSLETAEFMKLFENTFRFINIAFVNEMALLAESLGLNIWEVIQAAATKPFGYQPFYPGPGVGGACIPVNPFYLQYALSKQQAKSRMIEQASTINQEMGRFIASKAKCLLECGKYENPRRVLCLGVAYKRDVSDWRLSPAIPIIEHLMKLNMDICLVDPYVKEITVGKVKKKVLQEVDLIPLLEWAEIVIIITDHSQWDYDAISRYSQQIIDTRGVYAEVTAKHIWTIGKGKMR